MKENKNPKLLLLLMDGNALVHRAFHALPPLTVSRTGEVVNAVYGFASTLLKILAEFKPNYWAIAFDRPGPTFRHKMYEAYKAQREKTPDELISQIALVHHLVGVFNIPVFEVDGYEADDILGTLSNKAVEQGVETIIATGDNDVLQLLLSGIRAFMPRRSFNDTFLYDSEAVKEKYGVAPEQVVDFKALTGDASDNIPGIPGIGKKTAARLIQSYGNLEEIYAHINEITPGKLQKALLEDKPNAFRNKKLVTIVKEVPIELKLEDCQVANFNREKAVEIFRELEFTRLLSRLPQFMDTASSSHSQVIINSSCELLNSEEALGRLVAQLEKVSQIAILGIFSHNTRRKSNNTATAILEAIALSPSPGKNFYLPVQHYDSSGSAQIPLSEIIRLKPILENTHIAKICYDGKSSSVALAHYGVRLQKLYFDLRLAAYLLGEKNLALDSLVFTKLGVEIASLEKLLRASNRQRPEKELNPEQIENYAAAGLDAIWKLHDIFKKELHQNELWQLFSELEMPLVPVLAEMEINGIAIDTQLLHTISLAFGKELEKLEQEIYYSIGHEFNINSTRQLGKVLFEELKLPQLHRGKKSYSTEASVLEALQGTHPITELVLQYRQLSKLKSTYVDALPALVNHTTGRVHTTLSQTGTATGRLSSSNPNLQNIPIRSTLGSQIRQAIIAPRGSYLLSADYSQIDLRALAHLSKDTALIASFNNDDDIHSITAARVFGVSIDEVTKEMRRDAKAVNFGVIYGMSDYGLSQATGISREEAARFISRYFERYPGVKKYLEITKEQAREQGYVQTILGRRRFIPEINSSNRMLREAAERMAINAPVQGTSADIIKVAMLKIYEEMKKSGLKSKLLLQIHDELLFEVPEKELGELKALTARLMPEAMKLSVPLKITIKVGQNWCDMNQ